MNPKSSVPFPAFAFVFAVMMDILSIALDDLFGFGVITSFIAWPVLFLWALTKYQAFKQSLKGNKNGDIEKKFFSRMMRRLGLNALIEIIPFLNIAPGYIMFVWGIWNKEKKLKEESDKKYAAEQKAKQAAARAQVETGIAQAQQEEQGAEEREDEENLIAEEEAEKEDESVFSLYERAKMETGNQIPNSKTSPTLDLRDAKKRNE